MGNFNVPNYRFNPFTGVFTPYPIGYSGNPVETKTVPSVAPYWVYLDELPREDTPSTMKVTGPSGTPVYTEVSKTTPPATGQFRVIYGGDGITTQGQVGQGIVEFHSSDAGNSIEISYYGLGAILQNQILNQLLDGDYGKPSFADGLQSDTIDEVTTNAGVTIDSVLLKDKKVNADEVNEKTTNAGVTIESNLLKDNEIKGKNIYWNEGTYTIPAGGTSFTNDFTIFSDSVSGELVSVIGTVFIDLGGGSFKNNGFAANGIFTRVQLGQVGGWYDAISNRFTSDISSITISVVSNSTIRVAGTIGAGTIVSGTIVVRTLGQYRV